MSADSKLAGLLAEHTPAISGGAPSNASQVRLRVSPTPDPNPNPNPNPHPNPNPDPSPNPNPNRPQSNAVVLMKGNHWPGIRGVGLTHKAPNDVEPGVKRLIIKVDLVNGKRPEVTDDP